MVLRHQSGPAVHEEDQNIRFGNGQLGLSFDQRQHAFRCRGFKPSGIDQAKRPVSVVRIGIVPVPGHARHIVDDRCFLSRESG